MCGIFGIVQPAHDAPPGEAAFDTMRDMLRHRGPDRSGDYRGPGACLGNNRLAIVDLAGGDQPIFNEDGSLLIVYNGEVYNHADVRAELLARGHVFKTHSDTETLLHAFEEYGPASLDRLNGMFAFAVWNLRTRELFLACDRLGVKPLYYAFDASGALYFASEAKALAAALPGSPAPDWTAIHRYFSYGYVPGDASPFLGIRKFPPGHYAVVRGQGLAPQPWWKPHYGLGAAESPDHARERVLDLVERAVRLELMSDVPVGVFLSGGLDSSAVALFAKNNAGTDIHSFALKFEEATHDESEDARAVAEHLGLHHHEFTFSRDTLVQSLAAVSDALDEPFGDSTVLPLYALSRYTREHVKVVLTGWGGDEIFAGYPTYKAHLLAAAYRRLPRVIGRGLIPAAVNMLPVSDKYMSVEFRARRFVRGMGRVPELQHFLWMGYFDDAGKARLFRPEILEQVRGGTLDPVREEMRTMDEIELVSRIMRLDASFFLRGNGLFQADRMSMAASLEARVPLLNSDLLAYVNALPAAVKMPGGSPKGLLRQALAPQLPRRIIVKPKKGFGPPSSAWTRGIFGDALQALFARDRVDSEGIFNADEIARLIHEHRGRKADHGRNLWALLSFQMWYERFIKGRAAADVLGGCGLRVPVTGSGAGNG